MLSEDRILLAKIEDKARSCTDNSMITSSDFLDMRQRSAVSSLRLPFPDVKRIFYGGFEGAERSIAVFLPEYIEADDESSLREYFIKNPDDDPIRIIEVSKDRFSSKLSHRDYLGALMALGIRREMTGDIIVSESGCRIAALKKTAQFIVENLDKAGRGTLKAKLVPLGDAVIDCAPQGKPDSFTVSSLRLDSIVKNGFGISRSAACEAINAGMVFVNDIECAKADKKIAENDKIVMRHKGRMIVTDCSSLSKKGRVIVNILRFQ